ncbi:MAG: fluoride efflux transporter CrcB [Ardenticatenaceae bacterium]|nr:fluoride efflux transporter CrcB [Ardenticatenaceae bacterium]MCB9444272.1 fluoride efflux transporter CrcB [Ardenticatenaceae bacterium]
MNWISIAVGGAAGALLRYLVSGWAYALLGEGFPWGTLSVNLIGSFLIGFLWRLFDQVAISPNTRTLIFVGGLGAFTTFSTYGLESLNLLRSGQYKLGLLNVLGSNVLGILFVFLGFVAARAVLAAGR